MSLYAETPLQQGQSQLRIFTILSELRDGLMQCTFATFSTEACPKYQALSYEWGSPDSPKRIYANNHLIDIRQNLWHFLWQLKENTDHGYLWCDAICIDQKNNRERNHQVALMNDIYRRAHTVLVWLGEEQAGSDSSIRNIRMLSSTPDKTCRAQYLGDRVTLWNGLADLARRTYWTRIWIIQEITLAQRIKLFCGKQAMSWTTLATASKFPPDKTVSWAVELWAHPAKSEPLQESRKLVRRAAGRAIFHSTMYGLIRSQKRWPLYAESFESLSQRYTMSRCQDDRDRIFALLGIAKDVKRSHSFSVDYSKSKEEAFFSLLTWVMNGQLQVASPIRMAQLMVKTMQLSWMPRSPSSSTSAGPAPEQKASIVQGWVRQAQPLSLRCRSLGRKAFLRRRDGVTSCVLDLAEKTELILPPNGGTLPKDLDFDLFCFETSSVVLACEQTGQKTWTVRSRAYLRSHSEKSSLQLPASRRLADTLFTGLEVTLGQNQQITLLQLENMAQFMEIVLHEAEAAIWGFPDDVLNIAGAGGGGSLAQYQKKNPLRGIKALRIKALVGLEVIHDYYDLDGDATTSSSEQDADGDDEETCRRDWKRLTADEEGLARPRIPNPPTA